MLFKKSRLLFPAVKPARSPALISYLPWNDLKLDWHNHLTSIKKGGARVGSTLHLCLSNYLKPKLRSLDLHLAVA
ncbi:MAG: hypothetical protein FWE49_05755, partial [Synergistaceae bacterium]|nr:hypothetical protein [Synergistaceae bacterium]